MAQRTKTSPSGAGRASSLASALVACAVALGLSLAARTASASCAAGSYACGTSYCTPDADVCCASAGHPEIFCLPGQTCTTNGGCMVGGDGGGGGGDGGSGGGDGGGGGGGGGDSGAVTVDGGASTCTGGTVPCGTGYCTQATLVCCASAGHPELSCPTGNVCTTDGGCETTSADGGAYDAGYSAGSLGGSSSPGGCDVALGRSAGMAGLGALALAMVAGLRRRSRNRRGRVLPSQAGMLDDGACPSTIWPGASRTPRGPG